MIIGIDMGGTHIDGVIIDNGKIIKTTKNPTDRNDLFKTIQSTLQQLLDNIDKNKIARINLSTTVSTNAIVENKVSKVGMIVQTGPGMRHDFSDAGDQVRFISGYIDHRGTVVKDFANDEIQASKTEFITQGVEAVGVVSKFSTRNPSHELAIAKLLGSDFDSITTGHSLSGKLNFPRRVHTSYLNAAVSRTFRDFAENIKKSLKQQGVDAPVFVLKADGGTMDLQAAQNIPVETILSGPAASFMGLSALFTESQDGVLLDIGGTTTDIFFLANGLPLFEPLGITVADHKTLIRSIYSVSIGVAGDSFVRVENNQIKIGPQRMGRPIAFGGEHLTPTDAMVVLGEIDAANKEQALLAVDKVAKQLRLSRTAAATKILTTMAELIQQKVADLLAIINAQPMYTVKAVLENKELEPKFVNSIGGPSKVLAPFLAERFKLPVNYPTRYKVANAVGAALAKPTLEINLHADTERGVLSVPEVNIYEPINKNFDLAMAEDRALAIVREGAIQLGAEPDTLDAEIVESNSFNMVKGFSGVSKNIRVRAQITPGLIYQLEGHA